MSLLKYFHPVLPLRKMGKKPVSVPIGDEAVVLFRTSTGQIAAVKDRCPHRFTPLSLGHVDASDRLVCPYHGWGFDKSGEGKKPGNLGKCRVQAYQVIEKDNYLWVGDRTADASQIMSHDGWKFLASFDFTFKAPFHVVLDNFSEDEHFPFVHTRFGWNASQVDDVEHTCKADDRQINVYYWGPQRKFFGMRLMFAKPGYFLENKWVQNYDPVRFTYDVRLTDKNKKQVSPGASRLCIYFVPKGMGETQLHVFQYIKFERKFWYYVLPFVKSAFLLQVKMDLKNDADLTEKLQKVPYSLKGMALGQYDEPLKYSRQLLEKVYFAGNSPAGSEPP